MWGLFAKHHYLSGSLNPTARCFVALYENKPIAFAGILPLVHPKKKGYKRVTRLVVLPDWQGLGIGNKFVTEIAKWYNMHGYGLSLTTSNPALKHSLSRMGWKCIRASRLKRFGTSGDRAKNKKNAVLDKSGSSNRYTITLEFTKPEKAEKLV